MDVDEVYQYIQQDDSYDSPKPYKKYKQYVSRVLHLHCLWSTTMVQMYKHCSFLTLMSMNFYIFV